MSSGIKIRRLDKHKSLMRLHTACQCQTTRRAPALRCFRYPLVVLLVTVCLNRSMPACLQPPPHPLPHPGRATTVSLHPWGGCPSREQRQHTPDMYLAAPLAAPFTAPPILPPVLTPGSPPAPLSRALHCKHPHTNNAPPCALVRHCRCRCRGCCGRQPAPVRRQQQQRAPGDVQHLTRHLG